MVSPAFPPAARVECDGLLALCTDGRLEHQRIVSVWRVSAQRGRPEPRGTGGRDGGTAQTHIRRPTVSRGLRQLLGELRRFYSACFEDTRAVIIIQITRIIIIRLLWGQLWCRASILDCGSTGRAIDPAPGACFIPQMHVVSPGCPRPRIVLQCRIVAYNTSHRQLTEQPDVLVKNVIVLSNASLPSLSILDQL